MPLNGSGTFTRVHDWTTDKANAVKIRADRMDEEFDGIATALSTAMYRDGQGVPTADIPFGNRKITNLADATAATHAMNRQAADARYLGIEDVDTELADSNWAFTNVASAATCDIGAATTPRVNITGTTTITSFGTGTNKLRIVEFAGILTLTHSANLFLPAGQDIITAANDTGIFTSNASGAWRCIAFLRQSGMPTVNPTQPPSVASGATCDIGAAEAHYVAITGTTTITSLGSKANKIRLVNFQGALTLTHNASTLALPGQANIVTVAGDTALFVSDASGNWTCMFYQRVATPPLTTSTFVTSAQLHIPINFEIGTAVAANALTVALKTASGADPSASDPIILPFDDFSGAYTQVSVTAATSIVISNGSTLGTTNGSPFRLWLVAFNDAGTVRLGLINCLDSNLNIYPLGRIPSGSSTAEGGAGGADSAHVFYTGTAVTGKSYIVLGVLNWGSGLGTAGTWSSGADSFEHFTTRTPLPGTPLQMQRNSTGAGATGTTAVPADDTIPQITEGDQYMSQAITPVSAANLLMVKAVGNFGHSALVAFAMALFKDADANALACVSTNIPAAHRENVNLTHLLKAGSSSAITMRIRAGGGTGATTTFNGSGGAREYGGVLSSYLEVTEIAA